MDIRRKTCLHQVGTAIIPVRTTKKLAQPPWAFRSGRRTRTKCVGPLLLILVPTNSWYLCPVEDSPGPFRENPGPSFRGVFSESHELSKVFQDYTCPKYYYLNIADVKNTRSMTYANSKL